MILIIIFSLNHTCSEPTLGGCMIGAVIQGIMLTSNEKRRKKENQKDRLRN